MREIIKKFIEASAAISVLLQKGVIETIEKHHPGYKIPNNLSIYPKEDGNIYVEWQDANAINFGFEIDEDDYVTLEMNPDEFPNEI